MKTDKRGYTMTFPNGTEIKIRAIRYMKKLGAIRTDGMYYYPEDYGWERLFRYLFLKNHPKEYFLKESK